eukprot:9871220-Karenia_brevis.AAC.1
MSSVPGGHFSLQRIMHPLPCAAFGTFSHVLSMVSPQLAPPVVVAELRAAHRIECIQVDVENVIWKIDTYLPE